LEPNSPKSDPVVPLEYHSSSAAKDDPRQDRLAISLWSWGWFSLVSIVPVLFSRILFADSLEFLFTLLVLLLLGIEALRVSRAVHRRDTRSVIRAAAAGWFAVGLYAILVVYATAWTADESRRFYMLECAVFLLPAILVIISLACRLTFFVIRLRRVALP
jgi:hypothetical protein